MWIYRPPTMIFDPSSPWNLVKSRTHRARSSASYWFSRSPFKMYCPPQECFPKNPGRPICTLNLTSPPFPILPSYMPRSTLKSPNLFLCQATTIRCPYPMTTLCLRFFLLAFCHSPSPTYFFSFLYVYYLIRCRFFPPKSSIQLGVMGPSPYPPGTLLLCCVTRSSFVQVTPFPPFFF